MGGAGEKAMGKRNGYGRNRRLLTAAASVCCILFMAGCGRQTGPEQTEITLVHGFGGTLESYEMMQEIYDGFSEQNPDIRLNCIGYRNNQIAVKKANDMLAVGEMPDIVSTNSLSYYMDNAVKSGMALDLMPYIERDEEWKMQIHPSVFETWQTKGGNLYTIPDALELSGYWYNKSYLEQAGILEEDKGLPSTWEEFLEMAENLESWIDETGRDISVFSLEKQQMTEFLFPARLAGDGAAGMASVMTPEKGISREALANTAADLKELNGYSRQVENIESARQLFIEGRTVIYFNGVWESEALGQSGWNDSFGYACYPSADGESISYVSPPCGYVLAKQQDPRKEEACIRFLKYMLSDEVQKRIVSETGQAPCNPGIAEGEAVGEESLLEQAVKTVNGADRQIKMITSVWDYEDWEVIDRYLVQSLEDDEIFERMADRLDAQ